MFYGIMILRRDKMKYPEHFVNKIICGDCIKVMSNIPDNSIDLIVTSPPYDKIRDYKGFSLNLNKIGIEIGRVLKDGGICVMVIQDQRRKTISPIRFEMYGDSKKVAE